MTRALVIGAGLAGSTTAMALQHVGIEASVHEAHPRSDGEVGSYFTVTPNGLDALAAVDAIDLAQRSGFPSRRNVMVGRSGSTLGTVSLGRPLEDGTPALTMKRSRLARLLADEAQRRGIDVHHSSRLVDAREEDGRVVARFHDGTTDTADLLVGADGVHSTTRRLMDPHAPAGRYVGLTNFGGITPADRVVADLEPEAWQFAFGRHAFFGAHPTPAGDVVWFVNVPRGEISAGERAAKSTADWQQELCDLLLGDAGPAASLVADGRLELAADNTYDLGRVPVWHTARMLAIGDALHAPAPSSGQGASMALEDAVELARVLRDSSSVEAALGAFEARRRPRVERIVRYGARSSSTKTPGPWAAAVRDLSLRLVFRTLVTDRSVEWMYGHRFRWEDRVEQPAVR